MITGKKPSLLYSRLFLRLQTTTNTPIRYTMKQALLVIKKYMPNLLMHKIEKVSFLLAFVLMMGGSVMGQTYYSMSSGDYTQNFNSITSLPTNFSAVAISSTGTIPVATNTTVASSSSLAVVASSAGIGIDASTSSKLVFLTTGSTDNTSSIGVDLNLNFTGRTAGSISFDGGIINNGSGSRNATLRLYYSLNGNSWTEITGTNLPYTVTNNVSSSPSISITLPSALDNQNTVKLRFYYHNGTGGSTGSRPKITIDNLSVTSTLSATPTISLSSTSQIAAGNVNQGTTSHILSNFQAAVSVANATLNSIAVVTGGTYTTNSHVSNYKLMYNATSNTFGTATQIGTTQSSVASGSTITFSSLNTAITSGNTGYFWITADISSVATDSQTINIAANPTLTFASGTPTGSISAGGAQTFVAVTPSIAVSANHPIAGTINQNSTNQNIASLAFAVSNANATLNSVSFTTAGTYQTSDLVASSFKLYYTTTNTFATTSPLGSAQAVVASGNTITFSGLSQSITSGTTGYVWLSVDVAYNANTSRNISVTSTAFSNITFATGTLTGTDPVGAGNAQTFGTVTPSIAIAQNGPAASNVNLSATNAIIYSLSLGVTSNTTDFNSLTITTGGTYQTSDLVASSFKLYYTTTNSFSSATQLSTSQAIVASGNNVVFSGINQNILIGTTGYLWVTVDISPTAVSNRTINITSTAFSNITFAAGSKTGTDPAIAGGVRTIVAAPSMTELVVPQFIGSKTAASTNNARTPIAICLQFDNLAASQTYDIGLQLELNGAGVTSFGAGNLWNGSAFSGSTLSSAFITNSSGSSGPVWFYISPTGNGTRFDAAQIHNVRVKYVTAGGSLPTDPNFIGTKNITALDIANSARTGGTTDDGAFITGTLPTQTSGKFVLLYTNETGTGDPIYSYQAIASTATNATQSELPTAINNIFLQSGTSNGQFAGVVPIGANNANGIRRIEVRNADNTVFAAYSTSDGKWGSSADFTTLTRRSVGTIDYTNVNNLTLNGAMTLAVATSVYGTVTVNSGATLTTGGYLTLKSTASGTARIANSAGTISGVVTVERYIPQNSNRAWRTLSVPTYGSQTIADAWKQGTIITGPASCTGMDVTTNGYSMYTYNASTDNLVGVSSTATPINNNSTNPAAYFLYVRGDRNTGIANSNANPTATTLSTTGSIYQGTVSTVISANNGAATTYHLIGNPYVSPININSFLTNANNANNIENYIYVWDPKMTNTANGVGGILTLTYNGSGYDPTTTGLSYSNGTTELPSGMAFFVQKTSSNCTNCTVNFTESMKSTGAISSNGFKTASQLDGKMQINLAVKINDSTEGVADGLLAIYDAAADAQVVASEDAAKMNNFGESMSIKNGTALLAVEKRPLNNIDTLFINTEGLTNRNYRLVFNPSQFDPSVKAQLIDHYQNLTYPVAIQQKTVYDFTIDANAASKASARFELRYSNSSLGIGNTSNIETVSVYPNPTRDAQVFIAMHNQAAGIYQVQIVNAMGITVQQYDMNYEKGMRPIVDLSNAAKGVYYLKLSNAQKEQVVVKIINL